MFHRLPRQTVKDLRRRKPGRGAGLAWPAPAPHALRLRNPRKRFAGLLRPLGAALGAAMVGSAGAAALLEGGAVPALAPLPQPGEEALTARLLPGPDPTTLVSPRSAEAVQAEAPARPEPEPVLMLDAADAERLSFAEPGAVSPQSELWIDRAIPDGARYGDQSRLYMFMAIGDQAVGLNYLPDHARGWRRDGWSRDSLAPSGDAQAGIGVRRGPVQVSLAYVYRRTRTEKVYETLILPGQENKVAVTVSVKP